MDDVRHPALSELRRLDRHEVRVVGGFWADKQRRNADVTLPHCERWLEQSGWLENFDQTVDGTIATDRTGWVFADSEVYKLLEAMAWELGRRQDDELKSRFAMLVERIGRAQDDDGYIHTAFGHAGQPGRYSDLEQGHELYCFGHLLQAAVARLHSGHDDELVAIARRVADHVVAEFGPDGREAIGGHPEIEVALTEFGRALDRRDYIATARLLIDRRGHGLLRPDEFGAEYFQDDQPVRSARVLRGHVVRALYLAAGAFDVAVDCDDEELADAVWHQWAATVAKRTYVTGGMGARHVDEAFGDDFELPSDTSYAETCGAVASVMLAWRLVLHRNDVGAADLIDRTLHNAVLAGCGAGGDSFFYSNTLHQRSAPPSCPSDTMAHRSMRGQRAPWFDVSCCPTNVARLIASIDLYFAAADADGVSLFQYGDLDIRTCLDDEREVRLSVRTDYPFDGRVVIRHDGTDDVEFDLRLRIPDWADGATIQYDGGCWTAQPGLAVVRRVFRPGDEVHLTMPTVPRFVEADARIDAIRDQVAVERGPLLLCLESPDLGAGLEIDALAVDVSQPPVPTARGALIRVRPLLGDTPPWPYSTSLPSALAAGDAVDVTMLPYSEWANRGPSTMRVWMRQWPEPPVRRG